MRTFMQYSCRPPKNTFQLLDQCATLIFPVQTFSEQRLKFEEVLYYVPGIYLSFPLGPPGYMQLNPEHPSNNIDLFAPVRTTWWTRLQRVCGTACRCSGDHSGTRAFSRCTTLNPVHGARIDIMALTRSCRESVQFIRRQNKSACTSEPHSRKCRIIVANLWP